MAIYGGIDLGGTKIQAAVVDEDKDHEVLGAKRDQTPLKGGPKAIAARMAAVLKESLEEAGLDVTDLAGVGVGSPGSVDDAKGTVSGAMNLSEWAGSFNLRKALEKELDGTPVSLGNDVDLATDAEFEIGAARQYDTLLGVFWGTGVGGGLVLERQAVGRPQDRGRDRPHGRPHQRRQVRLRPPRLHGGLRRPRRDGGPRAPARRAEGEDRRCSRSWRSAAATGSPPASGSARWPATTRWRWSCSRTPSRRSAPASPPRSTCSTPRRS